jgi:hypothetical protein
MSRKPFQRRPKLTPDAAKPQAPPTHAGPGQCLLPIGWPTGDNMGQNPSFSGRPGPISIADPRTRGIFK